MMLFYDDGLCGGDCGWECDKFGVGLDKVKMV